MDNLIAFFIVLGIVIGFLYLWVSALNNAAGEDWEPKTRRLWRLWHDDEISEE